MKFSAMNVLLAAGFLASGASAFQVSIGYQGSVSRTGPLYNAMTLVDVTEGVARDVGTMQQWATNYGVQTADGFQLTSDDGENIYAMTNGQIAAGSPVVLVPNTMLLSSYGAAQEFGNSLQAAEQQLSQGGCGELVPLFRLYVKILAEFEKGDQSPFFPYLNSLPRLYFNGVSFTNECYECLPPYVAWLSLKERNNYVNFQKALQFVPISEATKNAYKIGKWAYNVAITRSFDANGEKVIAPMADMFNHGTETEVQVQLDENGNAVAYATRDIQPGSPLRISLGDPTNPSPLFATYGFLDESCPATFCKVMHLQNEMEELGYTFSNLLFYKETGEISPEVWDVMIYSVLAQDPNLKQGFYQAVRNGDENTKQQYLQQYFPMALQAMKDHVNKFLSELDVLAMKANSKDPSTHPRAPLILMHNEFVKQTFLKVQANLNNMG